jgi:hypothetical protein
MLLSHVYDTPPRVSSHQPNWQMMIEGWNEQRSFIDSALEELLDHPLRTQVS